MTVALVAISSIVCALKNSVAWENTKLHSIFDKIVRLK